MTLGYGEGASVDVNLITISHRSDAPVSPLSIGTGFDIRYHGVASYPFGGRVSLMWQPPANFDFKIDFGVGTGWGFNIYSVDYTRPVYNGIPSER